MIVAVCIPVLLCGGPLAAEAVHTNCEESAANTDPHDPNDFPAAGDNGGGISCAAHNSHACSVAAWFVLALCALLCSWRLRWRSDQARL